MNKDKLKRCAAMVVDQIEFNLQNRTGFRELWAAISPDVQEEITGELCFIAEAVIGGAQRTLSSTSPDSSPDTLKTSSQTHVPSQ